MDGIGRPEHLWMTVPDKENYREAVCDVDRNVAHCFFQSSTKKPTQKTAACREIPDHVGVIRRSNKELCEDFAPRNEGIRPSGEREANRPAGQPAKSHFPAGSCVKNLLPETKE